MRLYLAFLSLFLASGASAQCWDRKCCEAQTSEKEQRKCTKRLEHNEEMVAKFNEHCKGYQNFFNGKNYSKIFSQGALSLIWTTTPFAPMKHVANHWARSQRGRIVTATSWELSKESSISIENVRIKK